MKILILTDSSSLPRERPELCKYSDTWPVLLKENYEIHQVSIGAATSEILKRQVTYQKHFNPDLVIVQVGLADCAPRFMSKKELDFTYALGYLGSGLRFCLNRKWVRKVRQISYVNEIDFRSNVKAIKNSLNCPLISISIIPASDEYQNLLPGLSTKIDLYNAILQQESDYVIDTKGIGEGVMSDHMHLNGEGQKFIYRLVLDKLIQFN